MIINMYLRNEEIFVSLVDSGSELQTYSHHLSYRNDPFELKSTFNSVMRKLSKKTILHNVSMINVSASHDDSEIQKAITMDVLEQNLARSLDMPCIPIFMDIESLH